ncbi:MAG: hypothetical protein J5826_08460 [Bacteroidales bacterium]|nr:hypothetical protein [Bacteroidales bacterium]
MKIRIIKYFMVAVATAVTLSSCQDDDISQLKGNEEANQRLKDTLREGEFVFRVKSPKFSLTKGYLIDQEGEDCTIETGTAIFTEDDTKTFKTMKVYRQSDPTKYFYIMLTNLNIPYPFELYLNDSTQVTTSECQPYGNDISFLEKYGLLYSKYGADHIKDYIYMRLPKIKNGKEDPTKKKTVRGRLMNVKDLADLLEIESIYGSEHPVGVSDYLDNCGDEEDEQKAYYNAFVFGTKWTTKIEDSYHSLSGYKDIYNVDYTNERDSIREKVWLDFPDSALKQLYNKDCSQIDHCGYFWMVNNSKGYERILRIYRNEWMYDDYDWVALYSYAGITNDPNKYYGYAVRLVFDPFNN